MNDIFGNMKQSMERFFGTPAFKLARREDPTTSHQAAQAVDSTKLESWSMRRLRASLMGVSQMRYWRCTQTTHIPQ